jgi:signal transduction histidine kinase
MIASRHPGIEKLMQVSERRNHAEKEFHLSVFEVAQSLILIIEKHQENKKILYRKEDKTRKSYHDPSARNG